MVLQLVFPNKVDSDGIDGVDEPMLPISPMSSTSEQGCTGVSTILGACTHERNLCEQLALLIVCEL